MSRSPAAGDGAAGSGAAFDVVDSQLHLTDSAGDIERILRSMDELGITGVVLDELWSVDGLRTMPSEVVGVGIARPVSPLAHAASLVHPHRVSYVQRIHHRDPMLAELVGVLASSPTCRGVRVTVAGRRDRDEFRRGGFDELFHLVQARHLPVCVFGVDASGLDDVARRFAGTQVIVDHCGWPRSPAEWENVLLLASHPNVVLKWAHAFRAFGEPPGSREARQREFLRAIDAFGPARIMWASDATADQGPESWPDLLGFVRDNPALSVDDKRSILGGTARRVFAWPPDGHGGAG